MVVGVGMEISRFSILTAIEGDWNLGHARADRPCEHWEEEANLDFDASIDGDNEPDEIPLDWLRSEAGPKVTDKDKSLKRDPVRCIELGKL